MVLLLQLGCGGDALITLGQGDPRPRFFDSGRPIPILNSEEDDENPTLTEDMLEIYFTSEREGEGVGGSDVWFAKRESRADPFGLPEVVVEASSSADETSSAISADGNTLWVGSKRRRVQPVSVEEDDDDDDDGNEEDNDIWRVRRENRQSPWGAPELVIDLNSDKDDIPRPVALNGTVMPFARRNAQRVYQTFLAKRATTADEFASDPELISEIEESGLSAVDAFMTNDGLLLFFNRADDDDDGRLYMAWRRSPQEPFIEALPLDLINARAEDVRDPWISADGTRFVFTSNAPEGKGELDIYMAFIQLPSSRELASAP